MNFKTIIYEKATGTIISVHQNRYVRNKFDKLSLCPGRRHEEINFMYFNSRWPIDPGKHRVFLKDSVTPPCVLDENSLPLFCTERMLAFIELAAQYQIIIVDMADSMGDQLLRAACLMEAQKKYPGHSFYYTCEEQYREVLALCPDIKPFPGYAALDVQAKQCGKIKLNGGHLYDPRGDGFNKACVYGTWLNLQFVPYRVRLVIPPGFHERFKEFDAGIEFGTHEKNVIYQFRSKNWESKCWDVEKAVELSAMIHDAQDCNIYWLGTESDLHGTPAGIINLCGKTSWAETVHMLDRASQIFCIDSSIQHLSRALGKKYFTLWGQTHPQHIMGEPPRAEDLCAAQATGATDIKAISPLQVFTRAFPQKKKDQVPPYEPAKDVSQHGTQKVIFDFFQAHPPKHKFLIDVGAFGREMSNSFALLQEGWKGILFEPSPERRKTIEQEFASLDYKLMPYAISHVTGSALLHMHSEPGHDSLDPDWYPPDQTNATITVPTKRLHEALLDNNTPRDFDFLSIDTEGYDEKIISDFLSTDTFRPSLIVTESTSYKDAGALFARYGYKQIAALGSPEYANLVFIKVEEKAKRIRKKRQPVDGSTAPAKKKKTKVEGGEEKYPLPGE